MISNSKTISLAALAALGSITGFVNDLHAAVVINEVYGGGGSAATTGSYNTDFIELYNNGTVAADLTGLSVRYGSATGAVSTGTNNIGVLPAFSLAPGAFYLISGATAATFGGPALPTADATSNIAAAAGAGKVFLLGTDGTSVLDLVGYGSSSTGGEGLPAPTLTTTLSAMRTIDGVDTNVNAADFFAGTPTPKATNSVPEPTTLGLAAVGSALALRRRRQGR